MRRVTEKRQKEKKRTGEQRRLVNNTQAQQQTFRRQIQGYEKSQAKEKRPPRHPPLKIVRD